ncbi:hypothetical protein [Algoriphagus formosus]|uniref:Uncharacterized protein n=1 Tax=Algoriphagus formosus TaxID=2007308 RepID=A0A4V3AQI4_9BACT|nr:hypothetical protein [Algoriphagus aquimaris]TDK42837.1 hypothetical protein E1898_15515 [Algoriphagus aquimaris]
MIDLLNKLSKEYYLQLGDYKFSPITKLTTGMSLEYCKLVKEQKCLKKPFLFCLPEKKAAALWASISILTNYYLEDYVNIGDEGIAFQEGEKVMIYGCVAQIVRIQNGKYFLKFKGNAVFQLNDKLKNQLSRANQSRALNLHSRYTQKRKEAKKNRNPISKILYPKDEVFINQRNLKSKILIVAGRGQVKKFHHYLDTVEIYGEKLQKVFPEGENLIITPDLKRFKIDENSDSAISEARFVEILEKALNKESFYKAKIEINELVDMYRIHNQITQEFDQLFSDLKENYIEIIPQLKILDDNYPGPTENLHDHIRAVVLNDVSQLIDYPNTVKYFLKKSIPVIVFSDRHVINTQDIGFYKSLFQETEDLFQLNWNKKKLSTIKELGSEVLEDVDLYEYDDGTSYYIDPTSGNEIPWTEDVFIDQQLWDQAMRYEDQVINIESYKGCTLDTLAPRLVKQVRVLEEFEVLQKSFYRNFFPALYALKNSQSSNESVRKLINAFRCDFEMVVDHLPTDVSQDFLKAIAEADKFSVNSKDLKSEVDVFSIGIPTDLGENFTIPLGFEEINLPNEQSERIVFTGYPYDEFRSNHLINSVNKYFIPEIKLKCWPNEASLTYNYLRRRIEAGYFNDILPEGIDLNEDLRIESEDDIESEINHFLSCSNKTAFVDQSEDDIAQIHQFKYKGFLTSQESSTTWKVKCDVLNFENGDFMFLSRGSTILCLSEDLHGKMKVYKKNADLFLPGDVVFRYIKDRTAYLEISKKDPEVGKSYKELDIWKNALNDLYSKQGHSTKYLESFLIQHRDEHKLKGNPVHTNLERWLFDEEIISPDEDNLRLILSAAEVSKIEERLAVLDKAYKIATAHRISLSTRIKKEISKELSRKAEMNGDFKINVDGESIEVETRIIASVDRNGIQVDYHNTRKILC